VRHRDELRGELSLARAVVVLSEAQAAVLRPHLATGNGPVVPLTVVPPPHDGRFTRRPALPPPSMHGRLVLANWSGLHPLKGADLLVEAVARLHAEGRAVELRLAGGDADPRASAALRERARDLPVRFLGEFEFAQLQVGAMAEAHVFAGASRARETWGLVVDEAAALGLALVLPRHGAPAERFDEARGALLYEPGRLDGLCAALRRLLDEPGLLYALRSRLPSPDALRPASQAVARRMLALYADAVAQGPPPAPARTPEDEARDLAALKHWDQQLTQHTPAALGFS
jgi:glycosyltransferase involved in cell wall biosynthesis